jgi:hypothetical protein
MNRLRSKLTYSNVISTVCLFLLVGGGTAFAAGHLAKNTVGAKQLKSNAVTAAKLKDGAVTGAKIKGGAVDGSKLAPGSVGGSNLAPGAVGGANLASGAVGSSNISSGAVTDEKIAPGTITGDKVNVGTLPTVPNSATTNVVKASHGTLHIGQEATIFQYGPFAISAQCEEFEPGFIGEQFLISSSTVNSAFASWGDGSSSLGPNTLESDRVIGEFDWADSDGDYDYEGPSEVNVSASSTGGQAFNAFVGEATEYESKTCWYWLSANVIS